MGTSVSSGLVPSEELASLSPGECKGVCSWHRQCPCWNHHLNQGGDFGWVNPVRVLSTGSSARWRWLPAQSAEAEVPL